MHEWWSILILKPIQKLKKHHHENFIRLSWYYLLRRCQKNQRVAEVRSRVNLKDPFCQAEKKVISDVHVLACSDFYSKSALGEMGEVYAQVGHVQLVVIVVTYVYDICQD